MATDIEAVVYLMLMNKVLHDLFPTVITIGEDVSGMPTFCRCVRRLGGGGGCAARLRRIAGSCRLTLCWVTAA